MESLASQPPALTDADFRRRVFLVLVLGMLTRAAVVVYADQHPTLFSFPDTRRYLAVARNLAAGRGPIESENARAGTDPLYPALLAVGLIAGLETDEQLLRFGRLINTLAGLVSILLVARLGNRIAGRRAGLIAALIMAVDPTMNFFNALVLTETCYITLLLAAVSALLRFRETGSIVAILVAGVCLSLGTLTRSGALFLPLVCAPILWYLRPASPAHRAAIIAVFLASAGAVLIPTAARNYRLFEHIVPVRTGSGASLLEALGPWADGGPGMDRIVYPAIPPDADECERDRLCRAAAIDWARRNPSQVLSLAWNKLRRTWSIGINAADYSSPFFLALAWLSVAPIFTLGLVGIWLLRRQPILLGLLLAPAVYFSLVHMIFVGSVRYRLPAMPFLFLLAAVALDRLWRRNSLTPRIAECA